MSNVLPETNLMLSKQKGDSQERTVGVRNGMTRQSCLLVGRLVFLKGYRLIKPDASKLTFFENFVAFSFFSVTGRHAI